MRDPRIGELRGRASVQVDRSPDPRVHLEPLDAAGGARPSPTDRTLRYTLGVALALIAFAAHGAEKPANDAEDAQVNALAAEISANVQLQAFELLDDLVFQWTQHPIFGAPTPVVLADVTVPLSLGTGLQALIENHFASLLINNPKTRMTLTYCPQC